MTVVRSEYVLGYLFFGPFEHRRCSPPYDSSLLANRKTKRTCKLLATFILCFRSPLSCPMNQPAIEPFLFNFLCCSYFPSRWLSFPADWFSIHTTVRKLSWDLIWDLIV
ncbi:unnamed protein product [Lactuca virosa]|uniref:Uncharacterized protein n=1 Tax=Lactuca virosa TaxID=75947 RepID=A0AAU9M7E8_9ASTR|nr:unnamed protein product [Lactuca virosa]